MKIFCRWCKNLLQINYPKKVIQLTPLSPNTTRDWEAMKNKCKYMKQTHDIKECFIHNHVEMSLLSGAHITFIIYIYSTHARNMCAAAAAAGGWLSSPHHIINPFLFTTMCAAIARDLPKWKLTPVAYGKATGALVCVFIYEFILYTKLF